MADIPEVEDSDPALFTQSPVVTIAIIDRHGQVKRYNIYHALLARHSRFFAAELNRKDLDALKGHPALSLYAHHADFQNFIRWLYGSTVGEEMTPTDINGLWNLAGSFSAKGLQNELVDFCRDKRRRPKDLLVLLRELACNPSWPHQPTAAKPDEKLPDYLLEKVAFEISSRGWIKFIEAAAGQWERFVTMQEPSSNTKGQYHSRLMSKVKAAEELREKGELTDPATSACRWHDHLENAEEKKACAWCNPSA
ncbi:hypothetical protein H2200_000317 [Cladophialophora chaetospira]|uniref:BTB domain-containing protein n=1 Tax=Cladophialophora chaetospira TaxID=386627 RepID=A0AA39CQT9_9EURO|nr:hypothetical protein H2200_000317 [Cladophialophora chaetospira]